MVGYVAFKRDSPTLQDHQHWQALVIPSWFQDGFPYIHYVQYFDYGLNFSREQQREKRTFQKSTLFSKTLETTNYLTLAQFLGLFVGGFNGFGDNLGKIFLFKCLDCLGGGTAG